MMQARAIAAHSSKKKGDLNFNKGDLITVLKIQEDRMFGEKSGKDGWFPFYYVREERKQEEVKVEDKIGNALSRILTAKKTTKKTNRTPSSTPIAGTEDLENNTPKELRTFGNSIQQLMINQQAKHPKLTIPLFLKLCIRHIVNYGIGEEGPFRLSGNVTEEKALKKEWDRGKELAFSAKQSFYIACDLAKKFCLELSPPIIPQDMEAVFLTAVKAGDEPLPLRTALSMLPEVNQACLREIFALLHLIAFNTFCNKMNPNALAIVWVGSVFKQRSIESLADAKRMRDGTELNGVVIKMIEKYEDIFGWECSFRMEDEGDKLDCVGLRLKLAGHKRAIQCLSLNSSGQVWSSDSNGVIVQRDAKTCAYINTIKTELGPTYSMVPFKNEMWLIADAGTQVRDLGGEVLRTIEVIGTCATKVDLTIWIGGNSSISIFNLSTKEKIEVIDVLSEITSLIQVNDQVWASAVNGTIYVFNSQNKNHVMDIKAHQRKLNNLTLCKNTVWSCSDDQTFAVWDISTYQSVFKSEVLEGRILGCSLVGNFMWVYGLSISLYHTETFECYGDVVNYHVNPISDILPMWDDQLRTWEAWSGSQDKYICVWHLKSDPPKPSTKTKKDKGKSVETQLMQDVGDPSFWSWKDVLVWFNAQEQKFMFTPEEMQTAREMLSKNYVDGPLLISLTNEQLKEDYHILSVQIRKKMFLAIEALKKERKEATRKRKKMLKGSTSSSSSADPITEEGK